jgi:hypothetical protein
MPKPLIDDALWSVIEPLLPAEKPKPKGGRPRLNNRAALTGIVFVLKTGIPQELLPQEMGCGSGMACWRAWPNGRRPASGTTPAGPAGALAGRRPIGLVARAVLDAASVPAPKRGQPPARIQRIAANRARSAILWSTPAAPRWRSKRTGQRQRNGSGRADGRRHPGAGRTTRASAPATGQIACRQRLQLGGRLGLSAPAGHSAPHRPQGDRGEDTFGPPWPGRGAQLRLGSTRTAGCAFATSVGKTCMRRFSSWAVHSFAGSKCSGLVRDSKALRAPSAPQ